MIRENPRLVKKERTTEVKTKRHVNLIIVKVYESHFVDGIDLNFLLLNVRLKSSRRKKRLYDSKRNMILTKVMKINTLMFDIINLNIK